MFHLGITIVFFSFPTFRDFSFFLLYGKPQVRIADLCLDWSGKPERELHWIEISVEAIQWCTRT